MAAAEKKARRDKILGSSRAHLPTPCRPSHGPSNPADPPPSPPPHSARDQSLEPRVGAGISKFNHDKSHPSHESLLPRGGLSNEANLELNTYAPSKRTAVFKAVSAHELQLFPILASSKELSLALRVFRPVSARKSRKPSSVSVGLRSPIR